MDSILTWVKMNWLLAGLLYWVPLSFCLVGYTLRTWARFRADRRRRETASNYYPTDTVGSLIGRALVTALPVANLWAAVFDVAPEVFGRFFRWLGRVFDQPLVPARSKR